MNQQEQRRPLLGAHMSIAAGLENAIFQGQELGCTAIQIFTKSNRQWAARPITEQEIKTFKESQKDSSIDIVVAHASYLLNLGSPDPIIQKKSMDSLSLEINRCELLNIPFLVIHIGSKLNTSTNDFITRLTDNITATLELNPGPVMILLENMAGQGSSIGSKLEELALIREKLKPQERVGLCFDTCHAFAAGYDFTTPSTYKDFWSKFNDILGIENLKAIHLNDSKRGRGSLVDRHEHIGQGFIGMQTFSLIMNDPILEPIPKILETPKDNGFEDDRRNLGILHNLILKQQ